MSELSEWMLLAGRAMNTDRMTYIVKEVDDEGYLIERNDVGGLVFISFARHFNLTTEQKTKLANEFKDLLIKRLNLEPQVMTEATCRMCGDPIRYIGPHWEHLGELQPRHPAWPKEEF